MFRAAGDNPLTKKKITKMVQQWIGLFGLDDWRITLSFSGVGTDDFAQVSTQSAYKKADISINLDKATDYNSAQRTIIHELVHVALSLYSENVSALVGDRKEKALIQLEERVVTEIENWPVWKAFEKEE